MKYRVIKITASELHKFIVSLKGKISFFDTFENTKKLGLTSIDFVFQNDEPFYTFKVVDEHLFMLMTIKYGIESHYLWSIDK